MKLVQSQSFGECLQLLRNLRQVSQASLAARAGISRSTLARWEQGAHLPSATELDATLTALRVTPEERESLRATLPPRVAEKYARQWQDSTHPPESGPSTRMPISGDLLRSMRLRVGKTQADVARIVGVRQATVARWESGEAWPDVTNLHRLCHGLAARAEETLALTTGAFEPDGHLVWQDPRELEGWLHARVARSTPEENALADLYYLTGLHLFRRRWNVEQSPALHPLFSFLLADYAWRLVIQGRLTEAEEVAHTARRYAAGGGGGANLGYEINLRIALTLTEREAYANGYDFETRRRQSLMPHLQGRAESHLPPANPDRQRRALRRLRPILAAAHEMPPQYATWVLAFGARYESGAANPENAAAVAERAFHVIEHDVETHYPDQRSRLLLLARTQINAGQAARAVQTLQRRASMAPRASEMDITDALLVAEALAALGCRRDATERLDFADNLIPPGDSPESRREIQNLRSHLNL